MNIKDLTLDEVSHLLVPYLTKHFKDLKIKDLKQCLFSESYKLDFSEVNYVIPQKYHSLFNGNEWFNGASGTIEFEETDEEKIIMLLSNVNYSQALIFCMQKIDDETGDYKVEVIEDFMQYIPEYTIQK